MAPQTAASTTVGSRYQASDPGCKSVEDVAKATVKFGTDTVTDIGNAVKGLGGRQAP